MVSSCLKRVFRAIIGLLISAGIALFGLHFFLSTRGQAFVYQIPYLNYVVRLGKVPVSNFPKALASSFSLKVQNGKIMHLPKYVDDMIVDVWDDGALRAHDVRTGEQKLYYWTDDTAYICVNPNSLQYHADKPDFIQPDYKSGLSNYYWEYFDNGIRGDDLLSGFIHFEEDVTPGDSIKLLLKNRTPDADGAFHLIGIFLFISKPDCSVSAI